MLTLLACLSAHAAPPAEPDSVSAQRVELSWLELYPDTLSSLRSERRRLARALAAASEDERAAVLHEAGQVLERSLIEQVFPAWLGTPWDMAGYSNVPGEGEVGCSYFVSTTLRHAGLQVNRYRLAQQFSHDIVQTLVPSEQVSVIHGGDLSAVLEQTRLEGDGLYVVGLDNHVAFLVRQGEQLRMCHSSYLSPVAVVCEPAETAAALRSQIYVLGKTLGPELVEDWLLGQTVDVVMTEG